MPALFRRQPKPDTLAEIATLRDTVASLQAQLVETQRSYVTAPSQVRSQYSTRGSGKLFGNEAHVLYDAYKQNPWLSSAFDVIARRLISGGWDLHPAVKGADKAARKPADDLFCYVNPYDDLNQLLYQTALALCIFAEAYWEIVDANGKPYELYYVNPMTMAENRDAHGVVTGYTQTMDDGTTVDFEPEQILHFQLTGPLGERLSPISKLLNTTVMYSYALKWGRKFFEHGAKSPVQLVMPEGSDEMDAERLTMFYEENFTGAENAHRVPIFYGGVEAKPYANQGSIEMDFLNSIKYLREETLSVVGVQPQMLAIQEPGQLGERGESAEKAFLLNTVAPIQRQVCEKITYRILNQGFDITDWAFVLPMATYKADTEMITEQTQLVGAGIVTRKHAAKTLGLEDPGQGSQVAAITLAREVVPISDLTSIHGSQFTGAQQTAIQTGLAPHTKPAALAQASPRDPSHPGDQHPVTVRDLQQQARQSSPAGAKETDALCDLGKWQKLALRRLQEGKEQREFDSRAIPPAIHTAVTETLRYAETAEDVRSVFDLAYADIRGSNADAA